MLPHQMSSLQQYHSAVYHIPNKFNTATIITLLQTAEPRSQNRLFTCLSVLPASSYINKIFLVLQISFTAFIHIRSMCYDLLTPIPVRDNSRNCIAATCGKPTNMEKGDH